MANPKIFTKPWTPAQVTQLVAQLRGDDRIIVLDLGPRYLAIPEQILTMTGATTKLVTDATIAALALENGAEVHTHNARGLQRFPELLWRNPLAPG